MNTVMKLQGPYEAGNFSNSWATVACFMRLVTWEKHFFFFR